MAYVREAGCAVPDVGMVRPRLPAGSRCRSARSRRLNDIGHLRAVVYVSDRGCPGVPRTFIHVMRNLPRLACDPAGRQLYIVGGRYRVTARGIEG